MRDWLGEDGNVEDDTGFGLRHSCSGACRIEASPFLPWPGIQPKRSEEIPHSPAYGRLCFFLFPSSAYESKLSTLRMKTKKSPAFYAEDFLLVA